MTTWLTTVWNAAGFTRSTRHDDAAASSLGDPRNEPATASASSDVERELPSVVPAEFGQEKDGPSTMDSTDTHREETSAKDNNGAARGPHEEGTIVFDKTLSRVKGDARLIALDTSGREKGSRQLRRDPAKNASAQSELIALRKHIVVAPPTQRSHYIENVQGLDGTTLTSQRTTLISQRTNLTSQRTNPAASWEDFKERHKHALQALVKINELRTGLKSRYGDLSSREALLIPELATCASDPTSDKVVGILRKLEALQLARQVLKEDEEEYELAEEQLIAEEWALATLNVESLSVLDNSASPKAPDFPPGVLDFTIDDPEAESTIQSDAAGGDDTLPEQQEYESRLAEVNSIRVSMLDLKAQNDQLQFEAEERQHLGRKLDRYSIRVLERFDDEFAAFTRHLDQAQAKLEYAGMVLSRRKMVLEQEANSREESHLQIRQAQSSPMRSPTPSSQEDDKYYELADTSIETFEDVNASAASLARDLYQPSGESEYIFRVPSIDASYNMARFINQWLLDRVRHEPKEAIRIATTLVSQNTSRAGVFRDDVLGRWNEDGTEQEFIVMVKAREHSYHESLAPNNGLVGVLNNRAESQRLVRLRPIGPHVLTPLPGRQSTRGL